MKSPEEGFRIREPIHFDGPGPKGLHFKEPYGPDGERIAIDRARVRELSARNAEKQTDLLAHVLSGECSRAGEGGDGYRFVKRIFRMFRAPCTMRKISTRSDDIRYSMR